MISTYITKKQVLDIITDYLNDYMFKNGYAYKKKDSAYVKKTSFGNISVSLAIINYWPLKQDYHIYLSVKHDMIQNILAQFSTNKEIKNIETMGKRLVLNNSNDHHYKELYTVEDIDFARDETLVLIQNNADYFFEKYSKLSNVYQYYLNFYHKSSYLNHFIVMLICLKLDQDEANYQNIKNTIKEIAKKSDTHENLSETEKLKKLSDVVSYLDNFHP